MPGGEDPWTFFRHAVKKTRGKYSIGFSKSLRGSNQDNHFHQKLRKKMTAKLSEVGFCTSSGP